MAMIQTQISELSRDSCVKISWELNSKTSFPRGSKGGSVITEFSNPPNPEHFCDNFLVITTGGFIYISKFLSLGPLN